MAVVLIQTMPEQFRREMYDTVNAKLGDDAPDGLLFHAVGEDEGGRWRLVELWESRDAHDRFVDERLWPAIQEQMRADGLDPDHAPDTERIWFEPHNLEVAAGAAR